MTSDFIPFQKIPRLNREVIVTEKLDGTSGVVYIGEDGSIRAGSRNRWITPTDDNYGFAKWVEANKEELLKLGPGRHFGEYWGGGIQRGYGLKEKRFSLFNVGRWTSRMTGGVFQMDGEHQVPGPKCCHVVPTIWRGDFNSFDARDFVEMLRVNGSFAAPGFMKPEGIVLYHTAAEKCFKVTLEGDEKPKGLEKAISSEQLAAGKAAADEVFRQKCEQ